MTDKGNIKMNILYHPKKELRDRFYTKYVDGKTNGEMLI